MDALADIALTYFRTFLFCSSESDIDPDFACKQMESFPEYVATLSDAERAALSAASQRALDYALRPPDEYGYTPAALLSDEERHFLEELASGELYKQWIP